MPKAFGHRIKTLRAFVGEVTGSPFTQKNFRAYLSSRNESISKNTLVDAENSENNHDRVIDQIAAGFSDLISDLWINNPESPHFNPLKWHQLALFFDRLKNGVNPPLSSEDLIMDRVDRFLIASYNISLAIAPCIGGSRIIERSDLEPENFHYDNLAKVKYELKFAEENRRKDPGFKLSYTTKMGRIELTKPNSSRLIDDKNYRIHKKGATYCPIPDEKPKHQFEVMVFGGFDLGQETAHFSLDRPAIYERVSFSLDLSSYPDDVFIQLPELIIVPVLKNSDRDCCQIARDGDGMYVKPKKLSGKIWNWLFEEVADVMFCVRWKTDQERVRQGSQMPHDSLIRLMS